MNGQAKMVLRISYTEDWKVKIDDQIRAFVDENSIMEDEWDAILYDTQGGMVTGDDLGSDRFPLALEYTRTGKTTSSSSSSTQGHVSKATASSSSSVDQQVLPLRPRSTSSSWMYMLIRSLFFVTALMFYLGFFFDEEELLPGKPIEQKAVWPTLSWLLPEGFVSQSRYHWNTRFSKLAFVRQQVAMVVVILLLLRQKTLPALISIANIGGFGLCFHNYHLKSSLEDRWPMLAGSVLAVGVVVCDPESRITMSWKLTLIIFMYVLGFALCLLIVGTQPLTLKMTTLTTTTATIARKVKEL